MGNGPISSDDLRLGIERIERLEEEKKGIADDIKDVYGEYKAKGFCTKTMRRIVSLRKLTPDDRRELEAMLDLYKGALGMLDGTPLGRWAQERLEDDNEADVEPDDESYAKALTSIVESQNASVAALQQALSIGYKTALALISRMEREGVVSAADSAGRRSVLRKPDGSEVTPEPPAPEPTIDDARPMGKEAAANGRPVTSNPFPARDLRRAAWDEAWCAELGSDGMDIPDALKPTPKPKKGGEGASPGDAK